MDFAAVSLARIRAGRNNGRVLRYLARRLLLTIPVLLGVATLVFALIHFIPGDPARAILGDVASEADIVQLRRQLGLDRPLAAQYVAFLGGLARADLGTSLRTGTPVATQILERLPATFELALAAIARGPGLGDSAGSRGGGLARYRRRPCGDDVVAGRCLNAQLLAGAAAGDRVRRGAGLATGIGSRWTGASGAAGRFPWALRSPRCSRG